MKLSKITLNFNAKMTRFEADLHKCVRKSGQNQFESHLKFLNSTSPSSPSHNDKYCTEENR